MTRANTPPAPSDLARLATRVRTLERKLDAKGPRTFAGQDDVDADRPANNDVATYDATLGKWVNKPGGSSSFPVGPLDDGTSTFVIQTISVSGVSEMQSAVTNDSSGASAQVNQTVTNAGQAAVQLKADDGTGNYAFVAVNALGQIGLSGHGSVIGKIEIGNSSDEVGFFGSTPVVRQATPTDAATIIALLQAYGLCP